MGISKVSIALFVLLCTISLCVAVPIRQKPNDIISAITLNQRVELRNGSFNDLKITQVLNVIDTVKQQEVKQQQQQLVKKNSKEKDVPRLPSVRSTSEPIVHLNTTQTTAPSTIRSTHLCTIHPCTTINQSTTKNRNVGGMPEDPHTFRNFQVEYLKNKPYPGIINYTRFIAASLNVSPLAHVEPILPNYTPVYNDVASIKYTVEVPPCKSTTKNETSLFVIIISGPGYVEKRNAIRKTWLPQLKSELNAIKTPTGSPPIALSGVAFAIGRSVDNDQEKLVQEEALRHGDIIQVDMIDTYFNVTIKVAGFMNWIDRNCNSVDFLLKVDDDVSVNVRKLGSFLRQLDPREPNVYGHNANVYVDRSGKWKRSYEDYPWQTYPPYFFGPAYLMSHASLKPLLAAIQTIPYFPIEDVYLTGMCRERAGANLIHAERLLTLSIGLDEPCSLLDFIFIHRYEGATQILIDHKNTEQLYANATLCVRSNGITENPWDSHQPRLFMIVKSIKA